MHGFFDRIIHFDSFSTQLDSTFPGLEFGCNYTFIFEMWQLFGLPWVNIYCQLIGDELCLLSEDWITVGLLLLCNKDSGLAFPGSCLLSLNQGKFWSMFLL